MILILMNLPAASRGVSFKCFYRFYRSKLRGIKPQPGKTGKNSHKGTKTQTMNV